MRRKGKVFAAAAKNGTNGAYGTYGNHALPDSSIIHYPLSIINFFKA
jgi:hypothetical protein